jgi:hypothetical protein
MNERIKELWERACTRYSVYETLKPQDERKIIPDIFAELIIAECTQVLFDEAERLNGLSSEETNLIISNDLESCAEKCMDNIVRIEEHFGVE